MHLISNVLTHYGECQVNLPFEKNILFTLVSRSLLQSEMILQGASICDRVLFFLLIMAFLCLKVVL